LVPEGRADRGQIRALGPCWGEGGLEFGESWPLSVYIYTYIDIQYYTSFTAQGDGGSFKNRTPVGEVSCCDSWMAEPTDGLIGV